MKPISVIQFMRESMQEYQLNNSISNKVQHYLHRR
jgi:hypothetical protein